MQKLLRSIVIRMVALSLLICAPLAPVHAVIVSTEQAIVMTERDALVERVTAALQRDEVRDQLVALGVDPDQAVERVNGLTADELAAIDGQLAELPAGGSLLGVLGILLVVLIILDLVGVTNVFSKL
jgi:hypothetical protein